MPRLTTQHGMSIVDGDGHSVGGRAGGSGYDEVERYDVSTDAWTARAPMDGERYLISHQVLTASTS